ncbi:MAG: DUF2007 domain-containing protein [Alphaproteobacteria bacterium]|nr:DUF2007 domain-containing protein [Alphaproteobacteria bacterium]
MKTVLKSNNPVLISYAEALLKDAKIETFQFDQQMSVNEGSLGILPRRLMVPDEDLGRAEDILREGLKHAPLST